MTDKEVQQLAREYAEKNYVDFKDILIATRNAKHFLRWLSKAHCIVSRTDVEAWVKNASCFMPSSNMQTAMLIGAKKLFGPELFEERSEK